MFTGLTGDRTLFEGVKVLRPGTLLVLSLRNGDWGLQPYYLPREKVDPARYAVSERLSASECRTCLRDLLLESVERRLLSDVPVGTLCSGGLDSSLVTAMART